MLQQNNWLKGILNILNIGVNVNVFQKRINILLIINNQHLLFLGILICFASIPRVSFWQRSFSERARQGGPSYPPRKWLSWQQGKALNTQPSRIIILTTGRRSPTRTEQRTEALRCRGTQAYACCEGKMLLLYGGINSAAALLISKNKLIN